MTNHDDSCPSAAQLTSIKQQLLFAASGFEDKDPSGADIRRRVETLRDEELSDATIYRNLADLVDEGFLDIEKPSGVANRYDVTDTGAQAIACLHEWETEQVQGLS